MESVVYCVGELLIDMFCTDIEVSLKEGTNFKKMAGGAPANVAATIAKLGGSAAFAGKVGKDSFGDFLIETLEKYDVDTSMVGKDENLPTTLAFVSLTEDGERDFQFNRGADQNLLFADLNEDRILKSKAIHYGSATAMLEGKSQDTYFSLMQKSAEKGVYVSFDPNYRHDLWKGMDDEFIRLSKQAISYADFVKVSEEELSLITKENDIDIGISKLHSWGAGLIAVTIGKSGTIISNGTKQELVSSISIQSVDSTGAGDAFVGAILYQFANENKDLRDLEFKTIRKCVYFANKVGAIVCQKIGSLTALPTLEQVNLLDSNLKSI